MAVSGKGSGRRSGPGKKAAASRARRRRERAPATAHPAAAGDEIGTEAEASGRARPPTATDRDAAARRRREVFRERLESLEISLGEALRECGGGEEIASGDGRLTRVAGGALELYARLGRTLEQSSVAEALSQLGARRSGDPGDFGYDPDFDRALQPLFRFLYASWWRIETAGVGSLPTRGPAVLVANSAGGPFGYDALMLRMAVREGHGDRRLVRPLLRDEMFDLPVLGEIMARCGGVRASEENGRALLGKGATIACFPEGGGGVGRSIDRRYAIGPFADESCVRLALEHGVPIVPVAIVGAAENHPVLGRIDRVARRIGLSSRTPRFPWLALDGLIPLPSRWRIEFGPAVSGRRALGPEAAGDRRCVHSLAVRVWGELQSLVDGAVARRGRVFL